MRAIHPDRPRHPFRIDSSSDRLLARVGCEATERMLALPALNELYREIGEIGRRDEWDKPHKSGQHGGRDERDVMTSHFAERALAALEVELAVSDTDLARIPATGPLVVVANHPLGGADGLALLALLQRVRPDVKLVANRMLWAVPDLREVMLPVDAFDDHAAGAAGVVNRSAVRDALRWVGNGGALGIFPAGEVSHFRVGARGVADGPWSAAAARIARRAGAAVLPVFFEGRNSAMFQLAGLVHPRLRTALLPRELLRRRGARLVVHVGSAVTVDRLRRFADAREATDYLRLRSHVLKGRASPNGRHGRPLPAAATPVAPPRPIDAIVADVAKLPAGQILASVKHLRVLIATADQIPNVLHEIGRLREATFRLVGEGTGRAIDVDRFDAHYHHLFAWNEQSREVVGAYRLGLTDKILPRFGPDGLYTSTLFRFRPPLLEQLTPAVELGRSFVRAEYQREYLPLLLLWKGIGRFVAANPRYRMLFGPVSISADYASLTKQILMSFLTCNSYLPSLARLIAPRNPPRFGPPRGSDALAAAAAGGRVVASIDEVDELVAEIEQDRRRVPVLLRQYLKLGAKLLGFNVDPEFGDVLDGLMLVDLAKVNPKILSHYMGAEAAAAFRGRYG